MRKNSHETMRPSFMSEGATQSAPARACNVARTGYAAVEDELAYGVVALAVPVFDQYGRVVAALNSSSHSRRISKAKLVRERFAMLQKVSRQITADLAVVPGLSLSAIA